MDQITRQKIIDELTTYLNRLPSENEIMNCQTDLHIMGRIRKNDTVGLQIQVQQVVDAQQTELLARGAILKL